MTNVSYKPTEEEVASIENRGLVAAWNALQPLKNESLNPSDGVLVILRAFKATNEALQAGMAELRKSHSDNEFLSYYADSTDIMCSALDGLDQEDPIRDLHPCSVGGMRIAMFIKAAKALEAMSQVYSAFDDDTEIFGTYMADEAISAAEARASS